MSVSARPPTEEQVRMVQITHAYTPSCSLTRKERVTGSSISARHGVLSLQTPSLGPLLTGRRFFPRGLRRCRHVFALCRGVGRDTSRLCVEIFVRERNRALRHARHTGHRRHFLIGRVCLVHREVSPTPSICR